MCLQAAIIRRMTREPPKAKRFSMIREFHFADWFTLGNAACGTGALFSSMSYVQSGMREHVYLACALIFAALPF
jgi:CDP-diacylglycerol---serine O-phosphatidyltransferase